MRTANRMQISGENLTACDSRSGLVMMAMMILFGSITLLSIGAFILSSTDVLFAGQYARSKSSFFQAEGGLQAIKGMINDDLADGTLTLTNTVMSVNYTAPAGLNFDPVTSLIPLARKDAYYFTITGRTVNAMTVLEATFKRKNRLLSLGIFGNDLARGQPGGNVFSYHSSEIPAPVPSDSTGDVLVGSNEQIYIQPGLSLDGSILLGQDSLGADASLSAPLGIEYTMLDEEIPEDPLGASAGELEAAATFFSRAANNNNADAIPPIVNNRVNGSVSLPPGNYYLTDFRVGAGDTLEVQGTVDQPVRIFLQGNGGGFRLQPNSEMLFTGGQAVPPAFQLYALGSSSIRIQPNLDFSGLIYAPLSDVEVNPNGNIYGAFWGDQTRLQPGGNIWVDLSLLDEFTSDIIEYSQWKELREPY